jgi:branched-chain amino acid transport system substrate-binding protein
MRLHPARFLALAAAAGLTASALAGCGGAASAQNSPGQPLVVGISLPLTGGFSSDGQAFDRGYQLWQSYANSHGGVLGRKVKLIILNDNSSTTLVAKQYQQLIVDDHVAITLGPFSSLLTIPAAETVGKYGYAMIEGAGDAPGVFDDPAGDEKYHNVFSPSLPVADYMSPLVKWIKSMPAADRPKTAAYPSVIDPFAEPPVQATQKQLQKLGVRTVYSHDFTEMTTEKQEFKAYKAPAEETASANAQIVVLGSTDVPTVQTFMSVFEKRHYNPKIFVASSGPDQGEAFEGVVGKANSTGMMVPDGWDGGYDNALSYSMVEDYIAKYGGVAADINSDVAEAFSSGEVAADAIDATHSTSNARIMEYLHSGVTLQTVQGPARFNALGENPDAVAFMFQWQDGDFNQVLPTTDKESLAIDFPKPAWGP